MTSDIALCASSAGAIALIGTIAYERAMDVRNRTTLRLPFLILHLARFGTQSLYEEYAAELHYTLRDDDAPWIGRLANGLRYAIPLALGGTPGAMRAAGRMIRRRRIRLSDDEIGILLGGVFILTTMASPLPPAEKTMTLFSPPIALGTLLLRSYVFQTLLVARNTLRQWQVQSQVLAHGIFR